MDIFQKLGHESAHYRLVGAVTVGITKVPIIGFGYPEHFLSDTPLKDELDRIFSSHHEGSVHFRYAVGGMDRIVYTILGTAFEAFLEAPFGQDRTSISLFTDTAQTQKDFLIALTLADKTYLCFYDLAQVDIDTDQHLVSQLKGRLNKYVVGPAVPLLRTIETLKSQVAPQRKIHIPDEELGIIYQVLAGDL